LIFKEDGQEYAQVVKMLGNGRLEANCFDGVSRLCHIRGKLRKKVSLHTGNFWLRRSQWPFNWKHGKSQSTPSWFAESVVRFWFIFSFWDKFV